MNYLFRLGRTCMARLPTTSHIVIEQDAIAVDPGDTIWAAEDSDWMTVWQAQYDGENHTFLRSDGTAYVFSTDAKVLVRIASTA